LQISVDGKPKTLMYVGYEVKKESTWIYVEINDIATIKKLNLACNLLYEFQEKQSNIINATVNSIEKNYKLDNPKSTVEFSW
jgi:hypothetical protein